MAKIDDSVKKKVPELRFKGFTDEWEQRKLGDEVRIVMGQSPNSENYTDNPNDYILVQGNADMKNGRVLPRVWTTQVTKQAEKDDLILSVRAPVGDIGKTAYDVVIGRGVAAIKGNEFIFQNLGKMKSDGYWTRYSTGSTFESINSTDIKEAIISVPAIEEQDKIGSFFKQLDNTIALHQRKLDLLKEQKKGYLQKMFPKNGSKVPELRFAGFADDWEERKLGDHAKYRRGSFPQPYGNKEWYDGEGAMPFVQVVDVTNKLTLVENTKQKISKLAQSKSVFVPKGKVVVTLQGSIGRVAITQYDSFVDRTLLIFENYEKETDERFWAYTIQKKFEIEKLKAPGGTIKTITKEALSSFDVHLPKFEEQQKIGSFFRQLDETIALHQRKLELLKEQKKGFLQKMFV